MTQTSDWEYPKWSETSMRLPVGNTCAQCVYLHRCVTMFGAQPANRVCDFSPSRFTLAGERGGGREHDRNARP
jgi:hypothetical protein